MKKQLLAFIDIIIILLLNCSVYAEGSRSYNTQDTAERLYISGEHTFRVFAKQGERIYIGSSGSSFQVGFPDSSKTMYSGRSITNRTQELGPSILKSGGYSGTVINASTTGFYDVTFYKGNCRRAGMQYNRNNSQFINEGNSVCSINDLITAYDITVVSSSGTEIPGRVYTPQLVFHNRGGGLVKFAGYILTNDGYIFQIDTGTLDGADWRLVANNRGIVYTPENISTYTSVNRRFFKIDETMFQKTYKPEWLDDLRKFSVYSTTDINFNYDSNGDIAHRIFFNYPDTDLLNYLGLATPEPPPTISNLEFDGTYQGNESVYMQGGVFTFDSSKEVGSYELKLEFPYDTDGSRTVVLGNRLKLSNSIPWDGKDKLGNSVPVGQYTASITIKTGETHILFDDIETMSTGVKVIQPRNGNSTVYYDNGSTLFSGVSNHMNEAICVQNAGCTDVEFVMQNGRLVDANDTSKVYLYGELNQKSGVNSYSNTVLKTGSGYGDNIAMDLWFYGEAVAYTAPYVIIDPVIDVTVVKDWSDDNDRDGYRPSSVCVELKANNVIVDNYTLTGTGDEWDYTFTNKIEYFEGTEITYSAAENGLSCVPLSTPTSQNVCLLSGGTWDSSICVIPISIEAELLPEHITDQTNCENAGYYWDNDTCHD